MASARTPGSSTTRVPSGGFPGAWSLGSADQLIVLVVERWMQRASPSLSSADGLLLGHKPLRVFNCEVLDESCAPRPWPAIRASFLRTLAPISLKCRLSVAPFWLPCHSSLGLVALPGPECLFLLAAVFRVDRL